MGVYRQRWAMDEGKMVGWSSMLRTLPELPAPWVAYTLAIASLRCEKSLCRLGRNIQNAIRKYSPQCLDGTFQND